MQFDTKPIDFHQLAKPANLSNSAVLRMLEEEEARGRGQGLQERLQGEIKNLGMKPSRVPPDWPPPSALTKPVRWILASTESAPVKKGLKRVAWPPPQNEAEFLVEEPAPVYAQAPASLQSLPGQTTSPAIPPQTSQNYRPVPAPTQQPQSYRSVPAPAPTFSPPPTTITLRASPPISQAAPPVYASQPITATVRGGARSRGDQKWPPESVKQQAEAENEARIALAKGPAFRPRKVQKDYSNFFAQHALNSTYPGYRAPPGTQHYIEEGTSNL